MTAQSNDKNISNIIEGIFESQAGFDSTLNLNDVLSRIYQANSSEGLEDANAVAEAISKTIDIIEDNYQSLAKAKESGSSRVAWFEQQLEGVVHEYKIENTEEFFGEIKNAISESNSKIVKDIFGAESELFLPLKSTKFQGLNKTAIVNNFEEEVKNNTLYSALIFDNGSFEPDEGSKEVKAVKDYFESGLDSKNDKDFKKNISMAAVIAKEKGFLPALEGKSTEEITTIVDRGVTAAKVAHKVGSGEFSPIDAVEYTVDRSVATINATITATCMKIGEAVGSKVGAAIGSVLSPAGAVVGATVGKIVGKAGGYVVGKVIKKGVKKVATGVKSVAKKAWKGVKEGAKKVGKAIKDFFSF
ncbi:glycine zipper domain-containing protein [Leucothrix mucor]|uniref:glycine zipper domain-containing protein n=1 Tax=Leucothrix mucor TaxID=45248 RepID=UPI0003B32EBF|nr:glycine zipper domain-containing protein [Leucothrix mucor]